MGRSPLSHADVAAFRERATVVATELFARIGFARFSMRALAAEMGVSAMTPYRYFDNKEALFAAVRTDAFRRFADRQEHTFQQAKRAHRLGALGDAYLQFAVDEPDCYRIMFQLEQAPTQAYPELEAEQSRAFSFLVQAMAERVEDGRATGDPLSLAHVAWAQAHGLASLHLAGKLIMGRDFETLRKAPEMREGLR